MLFVFAFLPSFRLSLFVIRSVLRDHLSDLFRGQTVCAQFHRDIFIFRAKNKKKKKNSNNDDGFNEQITILTWPHKRKI